MHLTLLCVNLKNDENDTHEAHVQNEKRSQKETASKSQIDLFTVRVCSPPKTSFVAHEKTTRGNSSETKFGFVRSEMFETAVLHNLVSLNDRWFY